MAWWQRDRWWLLDLVIWAGVLGWGLVEGVRS
jgi:hypothetical protein